MRKSTGPLILRTAAIVTVSSIGLIGLVITAALSAELLGTDVLLSRSTWQALHDTWIASTLLGLIVGVVLNLYERWRMGRLAPTLAVRFNQPLSERLRSFPSERLQMTIPAVSAVLSLVLGCLLLRWATAPALLAMLVPSVLTIDASRRVRDEMQQQTPETLDER